MANKYLDSTGLSYFWGKLKTFLSSNYVTSTRRVNNKALSSDISLTASDVGALPLSGGTMTGVINAKSNQYSDSYTSGAIDMKNSNIVGVNAIYTADASDAQSESINFYRTATTVDSLYAYNGDLKFVPNRPIGGTGSAQSVLVGKMYETGTYDRTTYPLINTVRPNRLAFLPADQIIIETTIDGGETWQDAGVSDANKQVLFAGNTQNAAGVNIPLDNGVRTTNCGIRITFTGMKYNVPDGTSETEKYNYWNSNYVKSQERYTSLSLLWFWLSAASNKMRVYLYRATGANPNNWVTAFNTDFPLAGWSGSDWIRFSDSTFGGGTTQTGNYWNYRLVFFSRLNDGASEFTGTLSQSIYRIQGYGMNGWGVPNSMMGMDSLYSYDYNKNATFPANLTATKFIGELQGNASTATNATKVNNHTVNSDVPANAIFPDNNYTTTEKNKLAGIATGAEVNVQSDWDETDTSSDAYILNKPTIPSALSDLQEDSTHRLVTNAQITAWTAKSDFSGSYNDLTNKPTIPTALSQMTDDSSHRTVTDTEKATWNSKYYKASSGIPMSDLSDQVQTLLRSIGTETATFTDEIIIGDVRLKRYTTKRLMITDVES